MRPQTFLQKGFGKYDLIRDVSGLPVILGQGALGLTLKAFDPDFEREVVIKVLHGDRWADEGLRQRFLNEAKLAGRVVHANVATILDQGEQGGAPFLVMELVKGVSLEGYLRDRGRLSHAQAIALGLQAARGLRAGHALKIVHRDIKPANLLLTDEDDPFHVKIIDFGIAKRMDSLADDAMGMTLDGQFVGTPFYASPEQMSGSRLDESSDVYSLAATLWHGLCGQAPFRGNFQEILDRKLKLAVDWSLIPEASLPFRPILERALDPNPESRSTLEQLIDELRVLVPGGSEKFMSPLSSVGIPSAYLEETLVATEQQPDLSRFTETVFDDTETILAPVATETETLPPAPFEDVHGTKTRLDEPRKRGLAALLRGQAAQKPVVAQLDPAVVTARLGQHLADAETAVQFCLKHLKAAYAQKKRKKPAGVFLLVGRPGSAKAGFPYRLASALFGSAGRLLDCDAGELSSPAQAHGLLSAKQSGSILEFLARDSLAMVFLDRFEGMSPAAQELFLQLWQGPEYFDAGSALSVPVNDALFFLGMNGTLFPWPGLKFQWSDLATPEFQRAAREILQEFGLSKAVAERVDAVIPFP